MEKSNGVVFTVKEFAEKLLEKYPHDAKIALYSEDASKFHPLDEIYSVGESEVAAEPEELFYYGKDGESKSIKFGPGTVYFQSSFR